MERGEGRGGVEQFDGCAVADGGDASKGIVHFVVGGVDEGF